MIDWHGNTDDAVVSIAGRSLVWKVLKLTRPEIHQFIKTVQKNSCNSWSPLHGGPRKVLNAFETMACCSIIIGGPIDWWSFSANYWCPRPPEPQGLMSLVHWMSQRSTDTSDIWFTTLCPVTVGCLRDSLSVADSTDVEVIRRPPFEAPFADFCVTKVRQNVLQRHLIEKGMLKILAACHSGAPF